MRCHTKGHQTNEKSKMSLAQRDHGNYMPHINRMAGDVDDRGSAPAVPEYKTKPSERFSKFINTLLFRIFSCRVNETDVFYRTPAHP
jgi:hypothetical protein